MGYRCDTFELSARHRSARTASQPTEAPRLALGNGRIEAPPAIGGPGSRGPTGGKGRARGSELNLLRDAEGVVDLDARRQGSQDAHFRADRLSSVC